MTENGCHCEEAQRADTAIRIPRPQRLPCAKGAVGQRPTEGLSGVDDPFWGDLCRNFHPSLATAPQTLRCAPLARVVDGTFPSFVGADDHIGPLLGTTIVAPVGRGDHTPPPPRCTPPPCSAPLQGAGSVPSRWGRLSSRADPHWFPNASPLRRGGPMCPPGHVSARDPSPGRHTGRPLQILLKPSSTPENRAGTEPRPYNSSVPRDPGRGLSPRQKERAAPCGAALLGFQPRAKTFSGMVYPSGRAIRQRQFPWTCTWALFCQRTAFSG